MRSAPRQRFLRRQRFKTQRRGSPAAHAMNRRASSVARALGASLSPSPLLPSVCVAMRLLTRRSLDLSRHGGAILRMDRGKASQLSSRTPSWRSHAPHGLVSEGDPGPSVMCVADTADKSRAILSWVPGLRSAVPLRLARDDTWTTAPPPRGRVSAPKGERRGERGRQTTAIRFSKRQPFGPRRWTSSRPRARNTYASGALVPPGRLPSAAGLIVLGTSTGCGLSKVELRAPPLATGCPRGHCWIARASHTCPGSLRELTSRKYGKRKPHYLEPGTGPAPRRPLSSCVPMRAGLRGSMREVGGVGIILSFCLSSAMGHNRTREQWS
jgi:hypothetical protein